MILKTDAGWYPLHRVLRVSASDSGKPYEELDATVLDEDGDKLETTTTNDDLWRAAGHYHHAD